MIGIVVAIFRRPSVIGNRREIYRFHLSANLTSFRIKALRLTGRLGGNRCEIVVGIRALFPFNRLAIGARAEKQPVFARHVVHRKIRPIAKGMYVLFFFRHFHCLRCAVGKGNQQIAVFIVFYLFNSYTLFALDTLLTLVALISFVTFFAFLALNTLFALFTFNRRKPFFIRKRRLPLRLCIDYVLRVHLFYLRRFARTCRAIVSTTRR